MVMMEVQIGVPNAAGAGAAEDISELARDKTIVFSGSTSDAVRVEVSPDGSNFYRDHDLVFNGTPTQRRLSFDAKYARAYRESGTGGTFTLFLTAAQLSTGKVTPASYVQAADSAAADTTARFPFYQTYDARRVIAVQLVPQGAVTAHAANYATLTVTAYSSSGILRGTVAQLNTSSTSWVADRLYNMTLDSYVSLASSNSLHLAVAKAGTGVQLPTFSLNVHFES